MADHCEAAVTTCNLIKFFYQCGSKLFFFNTLEYQSQTPNGQTGERQTGSDGITYIPGQTTINSHHNAKVQMSISFLWNDQITSKVRMESCGSI
jgi:hypothetical protein